MTAAPSEKLLDAWIPPPKAGSPVGCLATSFTFSSTFFEEECLGRFVALQSDASEGPVYLLEREEELSKLMAAVAIVDGRHCRGQRNLRWDLLPARMSNGRAMHAKVSLLVWTDAVRVIVGSANLTEDGYRRNREIFGVLDYCSACSTPGRALREILDFLEEVTDLCAGPGVTRARGLLAYTRRATARWNLRDGPKKPAVHAVLVSPKRPSAFAQLTAAWPEPRSRPYTAKVVSPFFDVSDGPNRVAEGLWAQLRERGWLSVFVYAKGQLPRGGTRGFICAPRSIDTAKPRRQGTTFWHIVSEVDKSKDGPWRDLHAKSLWLHNERTAAFMLGSSNFTSAGYGISSSCNVEANLAYVTQINEKSTEFQALKAAHVKGDEVDDIATMDWKPLADEGAQDDQAYPVLPRAFDTATLRRSATGTLEIVLRLSGEPPSKFRVFAEGLGTLLDEAGWIASGRESEISRPWTSPLPPSGLEVTWEGAGVGAWWPVNVEEPTVLPPPDVLRSLSLEGLLSILTSSRPLKFALRDWIRRHPSGAGPSTYDIERDPLKRHDTSALLLHRTRRFSWALTGLRKRLEEDVATRDAFLWRLHGPFGPKRLLEALAKERRSDDEYGFLYAELLLEMSKVTPNAIGSLKSRTLRSEVTKLLRQLQPDLRAHLRLCKSGIRSYAGRVNAELR